MEGDETTSDELETMNSNTINRIPVPEGRLCTAHVYGTDRRCSVPAIKGGTVCVYHGGKAGPVREAANRRLLEMAEPALAALQQIVQGAESDRDKLSAAKDILDRVGLGATVKIEQDVHVYDTREEILKKAEEILNANANDGAALPTE